MTEKNERELAQLVRVEETDAGDRRLFAGVMAEQNAHGMQVRGLRLATPDDLATTVGTVFDRPPFGKEPDRIGGRDKEIEWARKRVETMRAVNATNQKELCEAVADLLWLERQPRE